MASGATMTADVEMSLLDRERLTLARGDEEMAGVVERAAARVCRGDADVEWFPVDIVLRVEIGGRVEHERATHMVHASDAAALAERLRSGAFREAFRREWVDGRELFGISEELADRWPS